MAQPGVGASPRLHTFASSAALLDALYAGIEALSADCLQRQGYFSIILAGGNTPRALYQRLRALKTDWSRWHIYFGDERCLPAGNPERNDTMAATTWLQHVAIPREQIHGVPCGQDPARAAAAYADTLAQAPGFDLALLGLGEDGHTASLFPGDHLALTTRELAIAVHNAPKPPPLRISLSPACLSRADAVWFIVTGEGKRQALQAWMGGASLPPAAIQPIRGVDVFTDVRVPVT